MMEASEVGQLVKSLSAVLEGLSSVPRVHKTNSYKLFSDSHTCAQAHTCKHTRTQLLTK